jgi:hypothetical protein
VTSLPPAGGPLRGGGHPKERGVPLFHATRVVGWISNRVVDMFFTHGHWEQADTAAAAAFVEAVNAGHEPVVAFDPLSGPKLLAVSLESEIMELRVVPIG